MKDNKLCHAMTETLSLPKDLMYGDVLLSILGNREILVENYKGIIEYTSQKIRLQTRACHLEIEGQKLCIEYYTNVEMKISGEIKNITYQKLL